MSPIIVLTAFFEYSESININYFQVLEKISKIFKVFKNRTEIILDLKYCFNCYLVSVRGLPALFTIFNGSSKISDHGTSTFVEKNTVSTPECTPTE